MTNRKSTATDNNPQIVEVRELSPHNQALYETGKQLLVESIETGLEFCKTMMGTSLGAIPVYLAILSFVLPTNYTLGVPGGITVALPAMFFLITSMVFAWGYLPIQIEFSLDLPEEVNDLRNRIISRRNRIIRVGLGCFVVSTLLAIMVVAINLGVR